MALSDSSSTFPKPICGSTQAEWTFNLDKKGMEPEGKQAELQKEKKYSYSTDESLLYDPTNLFDIWISLLSYIITGRIALRLAELEISTPVKKQQQQKIRKT